MRAFEIVGHLGQSPRLIETKSGSSFLTMSVAASNGYGDRKTSEWISVKVFGKRGEALVSLLKKGTHVYVRGEQTLRSYTSKSGEVKYQNEINASEFEILGGMRERDDVGENYDRASPNNFEQGDDYEMQDDEIPF